jgi:hypothetical protein
MLVLKHMQNNLRLVHLKCSFPRLSETNQFYILGLAEGLKYAQGIGEKPMVKIPDGATNTKPVFYIRSLEQKTCT